MRKEINYNQETPEWLNRVIGVICLICSGFIFRFLVFLLSAFHDKPKLIFTTFGLSMFAITGTSLFLFAKWSILLLRSRKKDELHSVFFLFAFGSVVAIFGVVAIIIFIRHDLWRDIAKVLYCIPFSTWCFWLGNQLRKKHLLSRSNAN